VAVDLDKSRAARREAKGEGPQVTMGGVTYELAPEMPFAVLDAMRGLSQGNEYAPGALHDVAQALLGKHFDAFLALDPPPTVDDLNDLIGGVMEEYGVESPLDSSGS
jgi:hypothetical protein